MNAEIEKFLTKLEELQLDLANMAKSKAILGSPEYGPFMYTVMRELLESIQTQIKRLEEFEKRKKN